MLDNVPLAVASFFHWTWTGLLLFRLVRGLNIYSVSLVSQDLLLIVYLTRYLELLALFISLVDTAQKVCKVAAALSIVLLIRYSPVASKTYEAELDSTKGLRTALILPPFILALVFNRVAMVVEVGELWCGSRGLGTCQIWARVSECWAASEKR